MAVEESEAGKFLSMRSVQVQVSLSRTAWAKVLQNELMVTALTVLAFFFTILIAGFAAKLFILYVLYDPDDPILMAPPGAPRILPYPYPITTAPTSPANTAPGGTAHPPSPSEPEWTFIDTIFLHHLHPANIRIWAIDFAHFASGVLLVGAVGAFSMLYYLILNPLGITDFGGGTGGFARRGGRRDDVSGLMILVIVVLGVFRAGYGIWKGVRWACRKSLKAVEDRILEVDEEDGNIAPGVPPVAPVPEAAVVPPAQG
ncbi:hypothetical protein BC829DRAFT_19063 [Chytridium lagenaria]|nr:hypothetical protein BC829DRAFT_19063 [Chytridium lagenaria]